MNLSSKVTGSGHIHPPGNQNSLITASSGPDRIQAKNGNDCVLGGAGDDDINGGPGIDVCIGGPGIDTFVQCETAIQ